MIRSTMDSRMRAGIAQLVEYQLPKLRVAGSNPVARSSFLAPLPDRSLEGGFRESVWRSEY